MPVITVYIIVKSGFSYINNKYNNVLEQASDSGTYCKII